MLVWGKDVLPPAAVCTWSELQNSVVHVVPYTSRHIKMFVKSDDRSIEPPLPCFQRIDVGTDVICYFILTIFLTRRQLGGALNIRFNASLKGISGRCFLLFFLREAMLKIVPITCRQRAQYSNVYILFKKTSRRKHASHIFTFERHVALHIFHNGIALALDEGRAIILNDRKPVVKGEVAMSINHVFLHSI